MKKGHFVVMKTGCYPMKTRLKLLFNWGIAFKDAYSIEEKSERKVQCADSQEVESAVLERFPPKLIPVEFVDELDNTVAAISNKKRSPKIKKGN